MESVEQDFKVWIRLKEILNECKVKDFLEHSNILLDRINDFNRQIPILFRPKFREIDLTGQYLTAKYSSICKRRIYESRTYFWDLGHLVLLDLFCNLVNLLGDILGGRSTTRKIIFDSKVSIRACY